MRLTVSQLDIRTHSGPGVPAEILPASAGEHWLVLTVPPDLQNVWPAGPSLAGCFTPARGGEAIRVPLIPFRCPRDMTVVAGFAVQFGVLVGSLHPRALRLHLVLGRPPEELTLAGPGVPQGATQGVPQEALRLWLGVAVQVTRGD